jgi:(2Fe-2S) ferredoxin
MPAPEKFVFVCTNQRPEGHPRGSCSGRGAREVIQQFGEIMDIVGLLGKVGLTQTGCMGPCMDGPIVVVYPDNIWYKKVTPQDVDEIVKEHLMKGNPVERLRLKDEEWG